MDTNINNKPLVSVIMAACNAEKYIDEAIMSVINQTYTNWELIIVDDKSEDKTSYIIGRYSKEDPRIKTFRNTSREGQALARNRAVSNAEGVYLAILDSDDIALPRRLETQVDFLEANKDIAVLGSFVDLIDSKSRKFGTKEKACDVLGIHFCLILQSQFIHSSVTMRREVFDWASGYDTDYLYAEDYDLWSRLCDRYTLLNQNQVLTKFRVHTDSVTWVKASQKVQIRNAFRVNMRNTQKYLPDVSENDVVTLSRLVNNRGYNLIELFNGLVLYRKLCSAYIKKLQLDGADANHIRMIWRNCLLNTLRGIVKRNRQ
jgi:glycosyltransferase involved in cell wall biosynthesis